MENQKNVMQYPEVQHVKKPRRMGECIAKIVQQRGKAQSVCSRFVSVESLEIPRDSF